MAKTFKIIMNIILILFIAALAAVFVPPFLGITTTVATPGIETNMQTGSVAYGVRESLSDLEQGDNIIVSSGDSAYLYEVVEVDSSNGEITVRTSSDSDTEVIQLRRTASRSVIVIPFLGYVFIATQSIEGLIILALAAALIIILSIVASVLKRQAMSDEAEEEGKNKSPESQQSDYSYFKDLAASTSRPNRLDELGTLTFPPVTDEDINRSQGASSETAALDEDIEEISELILEPADPPKEASADETINLSMPGINTTAEKANVPAEESVPSSQTEELTGLEDALESALAAGKAEQQPEAVTPAATEAPLEVQEPPVEEKPEEIELAIPIRTVDELLQEAYAKGEDPHVRKDPATGVTFVDYSNCF